MSVKFDDKANKTIDQLKEIFVHYSRTNYKIKMEFTFEDIREE